MNSSIKGIIDKYRELKESEKEFVIATIIETSGSTYRKAGARLLITRSGEFFGLLGGGCFEADLIEHAMQVFDDHQSQTLFYDMRGPEDLVWGLGLGCNGAVRIRLEYASAENDYSPLSILESAISLNQDCIIATINKSDCHTLTSDTHHLITIEQTIRQDGPLAEVIYSACNDILKSGHSEYRQLEIEGNIVEVFFSLVSPPVHFIIVGGGPDSVPVMQTAILLGWSITLIDYRENYTKPEKFPKGISILKSTPEELQENLDVFNADAVILMTHKYEYDLNYLNVFMQTSIPYIGLLGPTARKNELLKSLESTNDIKDRVFGPVGMDLGGELPEEIALSLVAEIQAVLHNREGGHLSRKDDQLDINRLKEKISVLILAAGGSSRFGALKQLLEYNGKSLLKRSVETALSLGCHEVIVVHGPKAKKCQREIANYNIENISNEDWESGLSSSLKLGLKSASPGIKAMLILLCDQPLIQQHQLENLIQTWIKNQDKIVASEYGKSTGVPVIIPDKVFNEIKKLTGDKGAKKLLTDLENDVVSIPVPEAEFDIDTQQDFSKILLKNPA
ncbi:MAG: NTP transferase domain-containing protein [Gammaproteobacteria bacterium]|nr:NTP transferase domain-containing protein [Gammaproteobacteria bacterium]